MSAYCDQSDVYRWIPRGSVQNPARLVSSVGASTDVLSLDGHGLDDDDEVTFRAEAGGSMPSPLVTGTTYYAIVLTDSTFQVSATSGGSAVDITTAGENVVMVAELPWSSWIEDASSELESTLPAHVVPLTTVPAIVRAYTSGLVAERALAHAGVSSAMLDTRMDRVRAELKEWRSKGLPIRGSVVPTSANLAVRGSATPVDSRGWVNSLGDRYIP